MTSFDVITIILSLLAISISAFTAYRTYFTRFRGDIYIEPRIILSHYDTQPTIIIGCEVLNQASRAGTIEDIVLTIKHRHRETNNLNQYSFIPLLMRNDYNITHQYSRQDFSHFKSISVPQNSQLINYIVFQPTDSAFSPRVGDLEMQLHRRNLGETEWSHAIPKSFTISLNEEFMQIWKNVA